MDTKKIAQIEHYPILCKYDGAKTMPSLMVRECNVCSEPLCFFCGVMVNGFYMCNECQKEDEKMEPIKF